MTYYEVFWRDKQADEWTAEPWPFETVQRAVVHAKHIGKMRDEVEVRKYSVEVVDIDKVTP
jgi:hypothetical protein